MQQGLGTSTVSYFSPPSDLVSPEPGSFVMPALEVLSPKQVPVLRSKLVILVC